MKIELRAKIRDGKPMLGHTRRRKTEERHVEFSVCVYVCVRVVQFQIACLLF